MLGEGMLYCLVLCIVPLVGMFVAIAIRAYKNEDEQVLEDVDMEDGTVYRNTNLIIDFMTYKRLGVIKVLKRRMYSRDGPGDTS